MSGQRNFGNPSRNSSNHLFGYTLPGASQNNPALLLMTPDLRRRIDDSNSFGEADIDAPGKLELQVKKKFGVAALVGGKVHVTLRPKPLEGNALERFPS